MPLYECRVIETVQIEMIYYVFAETVEEAQNKCAIGDTESSEEVKIIGVTSRDEIGTPKPYVEKGQV